MPRFWQNSDLPMLPPRYCSTTGNISLAVRRPDFFFLGSICFLTANLLPATKGRKMLFAGWILFGVRNVGSK